MRPDRRAVRVFVSSTFRDMFAEREELIKRVFPKLRKLCEERGVEWGDVDLRWGITEEQAERGEVLPVCLAEIDRCRPFFIGILGERYGWVPGPGRIPAELLEDHPWLREHLDDSVTEMEVLHGVLNHPGQPSHAFFYFRDPGYLDRLPPDANRADFVCEDDASRQKLADLKQRIRQAGHPVREDYRDVIDLGERVLQDLTALIDRLYPAGSELHPLDREAREHEAFANERLAVYIGRDEYFQALDAFARTPPDAESPEAGKGLMVLGESGSGKSALLANWLDRYRTAHPDEVVLVHFIGSSPSSADGPAMLRRLLGEFKRRLGVTVEVPDDPQKLYSTFAGALYQAAARGKVVLVLDALNQLEDRPGVQELAWLPPVLPANVRLIVSTLPGKSLEELPRRGWPALEVQPLQPEERRRLIAEYLARSSKALSFERVSRIAAAEQASNPLFLRALVEELRVFGVHEKLDERIEFCLKAADLNELFARILERYEQDYERERPGLIGEAMSLLWASRRGLTEEELLHLLGNVETGEPLPVAIWAPLYLAAEHALISRDGRLGFFHDYLRRAVEQRYVPRQEERQARHLQLVDYFSRVEWNARIVDELPWHLAQAEAWEGLFRLLVDLDFLAEAWPANSSEVRAYGVQVESHTSLRLSEGYRRVLARPGDHLDNLRQVSDLLRETGHLDEALELYRVGAIHYRERGDFDGLMSSLGSQGAILFRRGQLDEALGVYQEKERAARQVGDIDAMVESLGMQANILNRRGQVVAAMDLFKEEEQTCREAGNVDGLRLILDYRASVLKTQGHHDEAIALLKEEELLCRQNGDLKSLTSNLESQAQILEAQGHFGEAMALFKEQERLSRQLGDMDHVASSLGNQSGILRRQGQLHEAMALLKEEERICRKHGDLDSLQQTIEKQARILQDWGQREEALALYKEQERASRERGNLDYLVGALGNEASVLGNQSRLDEAMALLKEQETLCRQARNLRSLQACLGDQAITLAGHGRLDEAMVLLKEQESLCRQLGNTDGLARSLGDQGRILRRRGELEAAMALQKEAERLCRQSGNLSGVASALGSQAVILRDQGNSDEALSLFQQQELVAREVGDLHSSAQSLTGQGVILRSSGRLDEALAMHREAERLYRQLGDFDGLQVSLGNQTVILMTRDQLDEAMNLCQEKERLCRQIGNLDHLQRTLGSQASIQLERGQLDEAMARLKEQESVCRDLNNLDALHRCLGKQAEILETQGQHAEAMGVLKEQERMCRESGNLPGVQSSLGNQASSLFAQRQFKPALRLLREHEAICRQIGNREWVASSLNDQAWILGVELNQPATGLPLIEEARQLAEAANSPSLSDDIEDTRRKILDRLGNSAKPPQEQ